MRAEESRDRRRAATRTAVVGGIAGAVIAAIGNALVELLKWLASTGRGPHS